MQASVKLGLAFAAAAFVGFASAEDKSGRVKLQFPNLPDQPQAEGQALANPGGEPAATEGGVTSFTRKVIGNAGSEKAPAAPRANDRLRNAGPVNGTATLPDVAKTPTPPAPPVPIPYPNTAAGQPIPVPLPQPILRPVPAPVPAGPAKIDAITIKQK